jgi:hypothetical protein
MFCGNCGKQIPDGSGFCPSCGAAASGAVAQAAATGGAGASAAAAQRAKLEAQLKAGSQDAVQAFMVLLKDPVGGIAKSFSMFDPGRAMVVGLIFAGVYAVAATIAGVILFNAIMGIVGGMMGGGMGMTGVPGFSTGPSFGMVVRMFILYIVQAAALIAGCFLTRMIFKGSGDLNSDIYLGGACLLPAAAGVLIGALLGYIAWWLLLLPYLFAGCYTILMLYSGCLQIVKIAEQKAALAVPIILAISGAIVYIVLRVMM